MFLGEVNADTTRTDPAIVNNTEIKSITRTPKEKKVFPKQSSVLLDNDAAVNLNASFERNRGSLPWPVERGYFMTPFGPQKLDIGVVVDNAGITM